jgi:serine/threonine protein kinase
LANKSVMSSSQYKIKKKLGAGKQGTIYLVDNIKTKKEFAMKKIHCEDLNEASLVLKETFLLKNVQHENLVETLDGFLEKNESEEIYFCTIMNYFPDGDLSKELKKRKLENSYFKEFELIYYFCQLTSCVYSMHKIDLFHRDLKPENILLDKKKNKLFICDFGRIKKYEIETTMSLAGTLHYIAPEIMTGEKFYDKSIDIFSLGILFIY